MYDEDSASQRWKLNLKKFRLYMKSIKFLGPRVKTRVGGVSGNKRKFFRPQALADVSFTTQASVSLWMVVPRHSVLL